MVDRASLTPPWSLRLPEQLYRQLQAHLFPGDGDEHGAVIAAGLATSPRGTRLLARELFLARDGVDYVPGERGYRMLRAAFIQNCVLHCRDEQLAYLAVHNHGGRSSVGFSDVDLHAHDRGYPALLAILRGPPVGGLVFASDAVAGDLWTPDGARHMLAGATVIGRSLQRLTPAPLPRPPAADAAYDRQARLFGDRGQALLQTLKVGVIGAGGAGSLLVEYLARLGVGHLLVADPDRVELSNLPRVVGSRRRDALPWLTAARSPSWLQRLGRRWSTAKVEIARRVAQRANPGGRFEGIVGDVLDPDVAWRFSDCDYLFLAADTMQARLLFNAIVHQCLVPGVQVGAKVRVDKQSGDLLDVFSVVRPVVPDSGCLWCNGLITPEGLQREAVSERERQQQRYVEDPTVTAPSVITLNAVAAAHAANDFLFAILGLAQPDAFPGYLRVLPRARDVCFEETRADASCMECGIAPGSRRARGDSVRLPVRARRSTA